MARRHSREPVKETCPAIDEVQRRIKLAFEAIEDAFNKIEGLENELEDLRAANEALRDWGREEAQEVDRLTVEVEYLTEANDRMADELKYLSKNVA